MDSEHRPDAPDLTRRPPSLPQWSTADVHRGLLTERIRSVRRWVITASFLGTAAFSILAGVHTASSPASAATTTAGSAASTTAAVAQSVTTTNQSQTSIFGSGTSSSVALGSAGTTSSFGTHVRTASS